jgi:hypothetical protein
MAFVTLLAIAVGILSAIALLMVGLVEAPWQLLLVGLLAALYGLQRQVGASEAIDLADSGVTAPLVTTKAAVDSAAATPGPYASTADASTDGQALTYRGISYRAAKVRPEAVAKGDQVEGIYRGKRWQR